MANETNTKSEYTQRVEELAMQLKQNAEAQYGKSETGLIVISVNTEEGAGHDEVVLAMVGTKRACKLGLRLFATKYKNMSDVFSEVASEEARRRMLHLIGAALCDATAGEEPGDENAETKEEE